MSVDYVGEVLAPEGFDSRLTQSCINGIYDIKGISAVRLVEVRPGFAALSFKTNVEMVNPMANLHGGIIMAVADMAACIAPMTNGRVPVTAQCSFSFLGGIPVDGSLVRVESAVLHEGKSTAVVEVTFCSESGDLCVKGVFTLMPKLALGDGYVVPTREEAQQLARDLYGL